MRILERLLFIPFDGFGFVFDNAFTVLKHQSEFVLSEGISLSGGLFKPFDGFGFVLGHAYAVAIHQSEVELRRGVSPSSSLFEPPAFRGGLFGACEESGTIQQEKSFSHSEDVTPTST